MAVLNLNNYNGDDCYSDGDVENYILELVKNKKTYCDVPVDENSFPVFYHLSPERENIINWYPFKKTDEILEVGAGCGAITGVLCRNAKSVTSIELSKRRSQINFVRNEQYQNLEILVGNLNDIELEKKYDYAILNGVFEYAMSFTDGEDPYVVFLKQITQYLKPSGKILIAIENRLGLKYFSGATEDHTNRYYDGLNEYGDNHSVRTFSKTELQRIAQKCGITKWKFYYPYPDYKFPTEIFTDQNVNDDNFGKPYSEYQDSRVKLFDEIKMIKTFRAEGVMGSFTNSFLIELCVSSDIECSSVIYAKLNNYRKDRYCIATVILEENGRYIAKKIPLHEYAKEHIKRIYKNKEMMEKQGFKTPDSYLVNEELHCSYINSENMDMEFERYLNIGDKIQIKNKLADIYLWLKSNAEIKHDIYSPQFIEHFGKCMIDGNFLCLNPCNIDLTLDNLIWDNNEFWVIDLEWVSDFWIPVQFVMWRLLNLWYSKHPYAEEMLPRKEIYEDFEITERMSACFNEWTNYFLLCYVAKTKRLFEYAKIVKDIDINDVLWNQQNAEMTFSSLYIDYGEGFSELDKIFVVPEIDNGVFYISTSLDNERKIKAIRFDPTENKSCRCAIKECLLDGNKVDMYPVNAEKDGGLFLTTDPQFIVELEENFYNHLEIRGAFCVVTEKELDYIEQEKRIHGLESEEIKDEHIKIYFDTGDGYNEEELIFIEPLKKEQDCLECNSVIQLPDHTRRIRIDPIEGESCLILGIQIVAEGNEINFNCSNAVVNDGKIFLISDDPQIEVEELEQFCELSIFIFYTLEGTDSYIAGVKKMSMGVTKEVLDILNLQNAKLDEITLKCNTALDNLERMGGRVEEAHETSKSIESSLENSQDRLNKVSLDIAEINKGVSTDISQQHQIIEKLYKIITDLNERNKTIEKLYQTNALLAERNEELEKEIRQQSARKLVSDSEIASLQSQTRTLQQKYDEIERESNDYYNRLIERSKAADYWENYVKRMERTKSWKITTPLRAPAHILKKIREGKTDNSSSIKYDIKFSIIMPVYNVEIVWLEKAIESVCKQTYINWELCIADDASTDQRVHEYLRSIKDKRIKIKMLKENGGISIASNEAAKLASGDYILLMDNDDEIASNALMEFYECIKRTDADIIYSDQDIIDTNGEHSCPVCKPIWSPDLFCSQMYLGHLIGFRRRLFEEVGGFRRKFDGSQDYDLLLRITEKTKKIEHIDKILYSWRTLPSSTAANPDSKPYAQYAGLNAVQEHLDRVLGVGIAKATETDNLFVYDVKYPLKDDALISIIIPTKDHVEDLKMAIDSIFEKSSYRNFEIIILNNNSEKKETYKYFEDIIQQYENVKVVEAFYEFNWSKLNNHGMKLAKGDVYLFLNNDVKVLTEDWLERLASQALRPEIGAVGAMLLYGDGTIQHGGVVVGFGGWADHVYKGMKPVHNGTPFISPVLTRDVTAVTGACMAISRSTIEQIGNFDENFVICGSDVEICIRAINEGLFNVYDPHIRLYHYESKSRGTFVPQVDFELSYKMYAPYREHGDPYYNNNLDYTSFIPRMKNAGESVAVADEGYMPVEIPEITQIRFRKVDLAEKRLNILLPSLNPEHVFGGIATAYKFFCELQKMTGMKCRVIITDSALNQNAVDIYSNEYVFLDSEDDRIFDKTIIPLNDRATRTLAVSDKDYFIFTGWWTAYCIQEEYLNWGGKALSPNVFIYLIQDYEPGFYQWSSLYMLADSTYRTKYKQIAIFNSVELKSYFDFLGYEFSFSYVFEPILNAGLKKYLKTMNKHIKKRKQILVYGRPNTARNAFSLLVQALRKWVLLMEEDASEWRIISAGEQHRRVDLGRGVVLEPVGKLTIEEYAKTLEESYAGVSLMISPHPSYPPLEMAVFGVRVITNSYANKDMSEFNRNIVSLEDASPYSIAEHLKEICDCFESEQVLDLSQNQKYCYGEDSFPFMEQIKDDLLN